MGDAEEVSYEEFSKMDLRIGLVESADAVEKSENLLRLTVDFGGEKKQVVSGIKKFYSPEDVVGKKFVFITNMKERKIMGLLSQGMLLAAESEGAGIVPLRPEKDVAEGSKVK